MTEPTLLVSDLTLLVSDSLQGFGDQDCGTGIVRDI